MRKRSWIILFVIAVTGIAGITLFTKSLSGDDTRVTEETSADVTVSETKKRISRSDAIKRMNTLDKIRRTLNETTPTEPAYMKRFMSCMRRTNSDNPVGDAKRRASCKKEAEDSE